MNHLKVLDVLRMHENPVMNIGSCGFKTTRSILLGYGTEIKGYRLFDPNQCRVFHSRDVLFGEFKLGIEEKSDPSFLHGGQVEISSIIASSNIKALRYHASLLCTLFPTLIFARVRPP